MTPGPIRLLRAWPPPAARGTLQHQRSLLTLTSHRDRREAETTAQGLALHAVPPAPVSWSKAVEEEGEDLRTGEN